MCLDHNGHDSSVVSWCSGYGEKSSWIDYAVVSQGVPLSNFWIMDHLVVLSDHWPIQVSLAVDFAAVSESAGQGSRRFDWHACSVRDIDAYRADLDDCLRMIAVPTYAICCPSPTERCDHGDGLLAYCDQIETAMKEASKRHVPRGPPLDVANLAGLRPSVTLRKRRL